MQTEKERINYLPRLPLFFKIMGLPIPSSFMNKEFLGPSFPDKNTFKDFQTGQRNTNKSTIKRLVKCINQLLIKEGRKPIKFNAEKDIHLSIEQQEWKGYLSGLFLSDWNKTFPVTFSIMDKYLQADIEHYGNNLLDPETLMLEDFTILMILAALEYDYQKLFNLEQTNSVIIDILPKQEGEKTLWPMKLLFDSWRNAYDFKNNFIYNLAKERVSQKDILNDKENYASRTLSDWISGATPPNNEQCISEKTVTWIKEICGSEKHVQQEWLRFVMACKLQGLLYNKPDSLPYISQMYEKLFEEIKAMS